MRNLRANGAFRNCGTTHSTQRSFLAGRRGQKLCRFACLVTSLDGPCVKEQGLPIAELRTDGNIGI
jgi:hypothetical protein